MLSSDAEEIRAITFDVGMTLIEPWPSVGHVYAQVAAEHGFTGLDPRELTRRFAAAWKARSTFWHTRAAWAEVVDETFENLLPQPPSEHSLFDAIYQRFDEPRAWHIYDDVLPTLEALREAGWRLGVISNWDDRLRPLLDRLGLIRYFEALLISCEVGATKPSPAIFEAAARALELRPAEILHVGDSPKADAEGARSAGFSAVMLNRNSDTHSANCIGGLDRLRSVLVRSSPVSTD